MSTLFFFLLLLGGLIPSSAAQAQSPSAAAALERAQNAKTIVDALNALGVANPEPGAGVLLEAPDIAIAGRPVQIKTTSRIPGTDWIALLVDRGTSPLLAAEEFTAGVDHELTVSLKLNQTSRVHAIVRSGGKYYRVAREIKVARPDGPSR